MMERLKVTRLESRLGFWSDQMQERQLALQWLVKLKDLWKECGRAKLQGSEKEPLSGKESKHLLQFQKKILDHMIRNSLTQSMHNIDKYLVYNLRKRQSFRYMHWYKPGQLNIRHSQLLNIANKIIRIKLNFNNNYGCYGKKRAHYHI